MNANQLDGTFKDAAGKVQDAVGGLTGDLDLQAEGKVRELSGQAQANTAKGSSRSPKRRIIIRSARC
ncbi:CsbD-like protein [Paraburkholderia sp. RAU2J]|uniref:CsbD family protein n=1 Tax=Paraburkholderia sp. RAU2J TaxID=1938810 RepID=UPI000F2CE4D2|nr:CsbD family protein [Paraburkholderia sp. RAU2J]RKT22264.1 CsbD-like protein [Paraburkholderia sp. RAU2J]